ncbi:S9 family peptidase [Spiractinospora alimapuensis]|uniref:S9 family peptidase n=1 Tax=Spiractinospora alimapuensis TaxID=2820884 RepID=UPI001F47F145|nr:prolyl oligopeptidase family serine peptidase [Spiractinospora alimapuensis]QVQ54064.1 S9 family peptidase [Spiractinospora alimapuensis]
MSFPRQYARTQRFSLGAPRSPRVSADGQRVVFLRSRTGTDPVGCLWIAESDADGTWSERILLDPRDLHDDDADIPPEERARRERVRESGSGVVSYTADPALRVIVCPLAGRLFLVTVSEPGRWIPVRELPSAEPAVAPQVSPAGDSIAYVHRGSVRVLDLVSNDDRAVVEPDADGVTWGLAEFIAAEEMGRTRGLWWSPDGRALVVARVDESAVHQWQVSDPGTPEAGSTTIAYPAAGTPNADVSLAVVATEPGSTPIPVPWDVDAFPYLVDVDWSSDTAPPLVTVQSRDQREVRFLEVDPTTGDTTLARKDTHPAWVELMPGVPTRAADDQVVWIGVADDTRSLFLDSTPVTPSGLEVRGVLDVDSSGREDGRVLFLASSEPTQIDVWTYDPRTGLHQLTEPGGVHGATRGGGTLVLQRRDLDSCAVHTAIWRDGRQVHTLASHAETPDLPAPRLTLTSVGPRELRTAVILPSWHEPGSGRLPVLMDPYGGPHAQRVLSAGAAFASSRWFAEQGFAVVVADGRGSPGRGVAWETAVRDDLANPPLEDQVEALRGAAERFPDLDLDRVAIRGWSFGGYLAALAVLRRPEVFHAAVAGAPVTDWSLYDTHYTERYLGQPQDAPEVYTRSSLIQDAEGLRRPLMLIHGFADDNVVYAHTQRLSDALLTAARPHTVLPLSGITHMASDETTAESLLLLQVEFLRNSLRPPR